MKRRSLFAVVTALSVVIFLFGCCRVKTYSVDKDRVDQNLVEGNQGYLAGTSQAAPADRKLTRKTYVAEVELGKPYGSKGSRSVPAQEAGPQQAVATQETSGSPQAPVVPSVPATYTVTYNDTLQKISKKVYGTSKKWKQIFEANKDKLKSPDRIYPGQVLTIPQE